MKTRVCKKHREKPAIIYGKCIGCEIDLLRLEVQSLRSEKRRADVLAATLRELRDVVTSDVETKDSENSAQSKPIALDCALCGNKIWDYGEDNDGWYVSLQNKQIAWAASEYWAERIAECMNKACLG